MHGNINVKSAMSDSRVNPHIISLPWSTYDAMKQVSSDLKCVCLRSYTSTHRLRSPWNKWLSERASVNKWRTLLVSHGRTSLWWTLTSLITDTHFALSSAYCCRPSTSISWTSSNHFCCGLPIFLFLFGLLSKTWLLIQALIFC